MPDRRIDKPLSKTDASHAEELARQSQYLAVFLGEWLRKELQSAKRKQGCHVFVGFLASPYRRVFAAKVDRIFESLLGEASGQRQRLRKKLTDTCEQAQFLEALFELEVASLFLRHKHEIVVEPTYPDKGPDLKVVLCGQDVYVEAKKLRRDAVQQGLWNNHKTWGRLVTADCLGRQERNLRSSYLDIDKFPEDGYHAMVIDTFRRTRGAELLSHEWEDYCGDRRNRSPRRRIDVLILCCRGDQEDTWWLEDLTVGASVLHNPSRPIDDNVLSALKDVFSSQP